MGGRTVRVERTVLCGRAHKSQPKQANWGCAAGVAPGRCLKRDLLYRACRLQLNKLLFVVSGDLLR
jgi:hypothetical protein